MLRFFRKRFERGAAVVSSEGFTRGLNRIAEALEEMKVDCGHIEWIRGFIPKIVIDPVLLFGTKTSFFPKTFAIEQDGEGTITLVRCHYQRGANFIETAYEPTCSIASGVLYAVVNGETGEITAEIDWTFDANVPEKIGFALYKITASGDGLTATVDYETGVRVELAYE